MSKTASCTKEMFKIFFRSIKIYVLNFPDFFKYMSFPVLGTFLGLTVILGVTYAYSGFAQTPAGSKFVAENPFLAMIIISNCNVIRPHYQEPTLKSMNVKNR